MPDRWRLSMKVGDIVRVTFPGSLGIAAVVDDEGFGFYKILYAGSIRMMHVDYLEAINERR
jgi:hypothetical protein